MSQPREISPYESLSDGVATATHPALISSDICQFATSVDVNSRIFPVSSPTASMRLVDTLADPKRSVRRITNWFDLVEGANAAAVAALGNLRSAVTVHLAKSPRRHCQILTYVQSSCSGSHDYGSRRSTQQFYLWTQSRRLCHQAPMRHPKLSERETCPRRPAGILGTEIQIFGIGDLTKGSPVSSLRNRRHVLSRETVRTSWSSALKAMRVTVRAWPSRGCPNGRKFSVS